MKLDFDKRPARRRTPPPEHGDWRLPLDNPAEAEHWDPQTPSFMRKLRMRANYLQEIEPDCPVIPIHGRARALRLLISLFLLLPLSVVMVFTLLVHLYRVAPTMGQGFWLSVPVWFSLVGVAGFISLMVAKFAEPLLIFIYVLGHESTHAVAAIMSFGKINAFKFDLNGGYVETDADNIFIALSPYFTPFWMLVWMLLLWLANLCVPFESYEAWFYGGFGFWWAFHLYWTFWVIPREQPDMLENGLLFSMLIIMLMNIGVLLAILWGFGLITPEGYWADFVQSALRIGTTLQDYGRWLISLFA